jgi:ElaB/YqjD/DUF883 family membrane-anchored ribosome-binding protein
MRSDLSERIHDTLEQVGALSRTAGKKLEYARHGTADVLKGSAASVRGAGEAVDQFADKAAARLETCAKYVRKFDSAHLVSGIRQAVRRNPAGFIACAAALGLLCGLVMRRTPAISAEPPQA